MTVHKIAAASNGPGAGCDFRSELKRSTSLDDFKQKIADIITPLGLSDYSLFPLDKNWEKEDDQRLLSTHPEEYRTAYKEELLYLHDMVISYAKMNTRPIFTSKVYDYYCNTPFDTESTYKNLGIRQLDCSFGFFDSYAIPIVNGSSRMLFILTKKDMDVTAFQTKVHSISTILRLLSQAIYIVGREKFPALIEPPPRPVISITPRQLRTLETFANNDMSINQVADKLCVSVVTAQQHIAAARKALHVRNNQAAVKHCILNGLITYD